METFLMPLSEAEYWEGWGICLGAMTFLFPFITNQNLIWIILMIPPILINQNLNVGITLELVQSFYFQIGTVAHEWLPKVTRLISGRFKIIICYISLLCWLDFVALMFSLLVSGSVTCISRSVCMEVCMHVSRVDSFWPHGL